MSEAASPPALSLGIMAYNEAANIGRLLSSVARQRITGAQLQQIVVVASGCTDGTERIVREAMARDGRVRLLSQPRRAGKAAAINLFLEQAAGDLVILASADTLPEDGALERIVAPFCDPRVGMTGGRPVPVDSRRTFLGFTVNLLWSLHHEIALATPKLGEVVAFRNVIRGIPPDTSVDEASLEALIREAGYELRYVPEAVIRNKGPETVRDYLTQRRRISAGHEQLRRRHGYRVSTSSPLKTLRLLLRGRTAGPRELVWTLGAIGLEGLGLFDYYVRKDAHTIWGIAASTKSWE